MAYCNKCGAYIPDGLTACLACGYDEQAEAQKAAAATATASASAKSTGTRYSFENEELRRKLEEQRKKQQEQSRVWAEQERERRERAQQRAEREREERRAREEREREEETKTEWKSSNASRTGANSGESRIFATLSYLSVFSLVTLIFRRYDDYALYHARQGLALLIYGVVADLLGAIPGIGWIFTVFRVICIFRGMINASNGKKEPLPYIGKFAERF